jgi:hypothetical protein
VPEYNLPHSGVSVHYIINRIKCEVIKAADEHTQLRTDKWIAVANLTLQIDDEGSLAPNVAFINPLAAASTSFTFNAGANLTAHRQRIYSENFSLDIATLKEKPKTCAPHDDSPLTGDLGIGETVDLGLRSLKRGGPVDYNPQKNDAFGETVQFILTLNLNGVGPTWSLVRFKGPGALAGVSRKDTNQLIISFAPQAKKAAPAISLLGVTPRSAAESSAASNNFLMLLQSTRGGSGP